MNRQDFNRTLRELNEELLQIELADENGQQRLRELREDIQTLLEPEESSSSLRLEALRDRLGEQMRHFEVRHPTVAGVMDRTLRMLARMGI